MSMSNKQIPSGAHYAAVHKDLETRMQRITCEFQLKPLGIDYKIVNDKKRNEFSIVINTTIDGIIEIRPHDENSLSNRRFFRRTPAKMMRLPNGKVVEGETREMVHAEVSFISGGAHENATYVIIDENFAEVIDSAIECLSQIDSIYLQPMPKKRPPRRKKPNESEPGDE